VGEERDKDNLSQEMKQQEQRLDGKALSFGQKLVYASGNLPAALTIGLIDTWIIYFLSPSESRSGYVSLMAAGVINFLRYLCNAIGDPLVGWWSDRTQSKWGRRRPFIIFGTPFLVLFLVLVWFPPVQGISWANTLLIGFYLIGFGFLYPVVVNPYLSLMPEITPFIKERIKVSELMGYGEVLARIIAVGVAGQVIDYYNAHQRTIYGYSLDGYKVMAIVGAIITVGVYYLMIAKIKETPYDQKKAVPFGIFKAVIEVFRNPPFIPYIGIIASFILCSNILIMVTPFFGKAVMGVSEGTAGILLVILLLVAAIFFPLISYAAGKLGKKQTFTVAMFWFSFFSSLFPLVKLIPGLNPKVFGFLIYFLVAPPVAAVLVLQRPLISDVIDYDEKLTGFRRESMYMGAEGLITKMAWAISFLIAPGLMKLFGNTAEHPWGILLNGPVAAILLLAATFYFWKKYPFQR